VKYLWDMLTPCGRAGKAVKKNRGAAGIDKVSIEMFEQNRDENLRALMKDLKDGSYWPFPLRRKYIEKGGGKFRPLGIPAVRDRVAQEVVRRLVEPIFEPRFSPFSYGFRPGRNCHKAIYQVVAFRKLGYIVVLDADIHPALRDDNMSHEIIMTLVAERIADGNILRLIEKFLKSGVMEDGTFRKTTTGTPQACPARALGRPRAVSSPRFWLTIVLDVLDRELAKHGYVPPLAGYADDFPWPA